MSEAVDILRRMRKQSRTESEKDALGLAIIAVKKFSSADTKFDRDAFSCTCPSCGKIIPVLGREGMEMFCMYCGQHITLKGGKA